MHPRRQDRDGEYLYAIVSAEDVRQVVAEAPVGMRDRKVHCVVTNGLAAVVSDVPRAKMRPSRANLSAHHGVQRALLGLPITFLPVSFGVIADGSRAVEQILGLNSATLEAQLQRVRMGVEMILRVSWSVPNIFEYFVNTHDELKDLRDRLFHGGREPTPDQKMRLGRLFEQALIRDRERYTRDVRGALSRYCREIEQNDPRDEREVMNLACLIDRDSERRFEERVVKAAELFDGRLCFEYNGPLPPYDFVEADLELRA